MKELDCPLDRAKEAQIEYSELLKLRLSAAHSTMSELYGSCNAMLDLCRLMDYGELYQELDGVLPKVVELSNKLYKTINADLQDASSHFTDEDYKMYMIKQITTKEKI